MASVNNVVINAKKYANVRVNKAGTWKAPLELWVKKAGVWAEVDQVWVKRSGVWVKVTPGFNFLEFSGSSYLTVPGGHFNNYVDTGNTYAIYQFKLLLRNTGARQTLFSYGASATHCDIYIDTDNKVKVSTRYNSGSTWIVTHATVLAVNTLYIIDVRMKYGSVLIKLYNANASPIGTDISSGSVSVTQNTATKYIGQRYDALYRFTGIMRQIYMYGGNVSTSTTKYTFDSGDWFSGSAKGSATITDIATADGVQNLTATGCTVGHTGG